MYGICNKHCDSGAEYSPQDFGFLLPDRHYHVLKPSGAATVGPFEAVGLSEFHLAPNIMILK